MQCSPTASGTFTCFTYEQLRTIARKYNRLHEKSERIVISRQKKQLWQNINQKMNKTCKSDESCWVTNDEVLRARFRPDQPEEWKLNPRTWLSNIDIHHVLKQYEKKYSSFAHLGVFPKNYDDLLLGQCVSEELCNLSVSDQLSNKKYQLGLVFNTDPHYMPGAHWVAVYMNVNPKAKKFGFYFYDSNADEPFSQIQNLYMAVRRQLLDVSDREFKFHVNDVKHQFKNTECGMFSINFLVEMLKRSSTFNDIVNRKIDDDYVFSLRSKFFKNA